MAAGRTTLEAETVTGIVILVQVGVVPPARDLPTRVVARRTKAVFMVGSMLSAVVGEGQGLRFERRWYEEKGKGSSRISRSYLSCAPVYHRRTEVVLFEAVVALFWAL